MPVVSLELCQSLAYCNFKGKCVNDGPNTAEKCQCYPGFSGDKCEKVVENADNAKILENPKTSVHVTEPIKEEVEIIENPVHVAVKESISEDPVEEHEIVTDGAKEGYVIFEPKPAVEKAVIIRRLFQKPPPATIVGNVPTLYEDQKLFFKQFSFVTSPPTTTVAPAAAVATSTFLLSTPFILSSSCVLMGIGLATAVVWLVKKKPTLLRNIKKRFCCKNEPEDLLSFGNENHQPFTCTNPFSTLAPSLASPLEDFHDPFGNKDLEQFNGHKDDSKNHIKGHMDFDIKKDPDQHHIKGQKKFDNPFTKDLDKYPDEEQFKEQYDKC